MKITGGYNPYVYQRQRTDIKYTGFEDLLASWGKYSGETGTQTTSVSREFDVQKAYEEAAAQTEGVRSGVEPANKLSDFSKKGWTVFCKMYGIDTTRTLNEDSSGDKELTLEQIVMLKNKYDVNNLTEQERYDLLCELTDMGVLSADDVRLTTVGNIYTMTGSTLVQHSGLGNDPLWHVTIPDNDFASYMMAWVQKEQSGYDYMVGLGGKFEELEEYEQRRYQQFQNDIQNIDNLTASHKKVANVLSRLVRQ